MEKKSNKVSLCCIVALIIIVLVILCCCKTFLFKQNKKGVLSTLPDDFQKYQDPVNWDYEKLHDYFSKIDKNSEKFIGIDEYDFIDVKNDKLVWNVNNKWIDDSIIKEDISYLYLDSNAFYEEFLVLTKSNIVYKLEVGINELLNDEESKDLKTLNESDYKRIKYNKIDYKGSITNISHKSVPTESKIIFYLESDGKIYVLSDEEIKSLEDYYDGYDIINLDNTCYPSDIKVKIGFNGESNVLDHNGKKIGVKHYIYLQDGESDAPIYNIIIDNNNNLYSFTNDAFKENVYFNSINSKVVDYKVTESSGGHDSIYIKLDNGKIITVG